MDKNLAKYQQINDAIIFLFSKVPEVYGTDFNNCNDFLKSCEIVWNQMNQCKIDYEQSLIESPSE